MTRREREQLQHALDAFEVGDTRLGVDLVIDLLEGAEQAAHSTIVERRQHRCDHCAMTFEWPGLLEQHRGLAHGEWD